MGWMAQACALLACLFLAALAALVIFNIVTGKMDLQFLVSEANGHASMSRFQLLIFTLVIGLSFVLVVANTNKMPEISTQVLMLLGISGSTYAVSKGIQATTPEGMAPKGAAPTPGQKSPGAQGGGHQAQSAGAGPSSQGAR